MVLTFKLTTCLTFRRKFDLMLIKILKIEYVFFHFVSTLTEYFSFRFIQFSAKPLNILKMKNKKGSFPHFVFDFLAKYFVNKKACQGNTNHTLTDNLLYTKPIWVDVW